MPDSTKPNRGHGPNSPKRPNSGERRARSKSLSGQSGRRQKIKIDRPRMTAFDLINEVEFNGAYANIALPRLLTDRELSGLDARFTTELAFGTLRLQGRYDAIISAAARRKPSEIDPPLLNAIRLGAHQLLGMNVPSYAAVSVMVELVGQKLGPGQAKFANAVLRKIGSQSLADWAEAVYPDPSADELGYLSVAQSHPEWVVSAFRAALAGSARSPGELESLLQTNNTPPDVTLVARPARMSQESLLAQAGATSGRYSPWAVKIEGDPGAVSSVRSGAAGVQDEGSQLMALALSRATVSGADERWLDMCAGPGGKSADLAGLAQAIGAGFVATEIHEHRADLVRRALMWQGEAMGVVHVCDAADPVSFTETYSRVLLDAPCTGLGAIRRRPEARWRRTPADLSDLVELQFRLLQNGLDVLAPGGVLAYVTCSPVLEETSYLVERVLQTRTEMRTIPAGPLLPEVPDIASGPYARLWPHLHGTDGMFLAMIQRKPD
jgi:16S rRNA (cytosine967-C5)-methyltransferase